MNLPRIFRRTRPTPDMTEANKAAISAEYRARLHEIEIMDAWNIDPAKWSALTAQKRADYRTLYTKAPGYQK